MIETLRVRRSAAFIFALLLPACAGLGQGYPLGVSKSFGTSSIPVGGTAKLTFFIMNPGGGILTGVGFIDNLPSGLVVATPNGLSNQVGGCTGTIMPITAVSGSSTISVAGVRLIPQSGCMFSVDVTGTSPGVKNNVAGPITSIQTGPTTTANASITVEGEVVVPTISSIGLLAFGLLLAVGGYLFARKSSGSA